MGDILGCGTAAKYAVLEQFKIDRDMLAPGIYFSLHQYSTSVSSLKPIAEHPAEAVKGRYESENTAHIAQT